MRLDLVRASPAAGPATPGTRPLQRGTPVRLIIWTVPKRVSIRKRKTGPARSAVCGGSGGRPHSSGHRIVSLGVPVRARLRAATGGRRSRPARWNAAVGNSVGGTATRCGRQALGDVTGQGRAVVGWRDRAASVRHGAGHPWPTRGGGATVRWSIATCRSLRYTGRRARGCLIRADRDRRPPAVRWLRPARRRYASGECASGSSGSDGVIGSLIRYVPSNHLPRSTILQRRLQNGRHGASSLVGVVNEVPHVGQ